MVRSSEYIESINKEAWSATISRSKFTLYSELHARRRTTRNKAGFFMRYSTDASPTIRWVELEFTD